MTIFNFLKMLIGNCSEFWFATGRRFTRQTAVPSKFCVSAAMFCFASRFGSFLLCCREIQLTSRGVFSLLLLLITLTVFKRVEDSQESNGL